MSKPLNAVGKNNTPEAIRRDEWLKAWQDAEREQFDPINPDALTITELAPHFGLSKRRTRERVKLMVEQGKAIVVKKRARKVDGTAHIIPAYILKKK